MSFTLPRPRARRPVSLAFSHALHAVAYSCLFAALLITFAFQAARPSSALWPAMIAVAVMIGLIYVVDRTNNTWFAITYILVGAACSYWYVLTFFSQSPAILPSDAFSIALPKVALVMVAGPAANLRMRLLWCVAGYLAAELSVGAAIVMAGHTLTFDVTTFLAFAVTAVIFVLGSITRRPSRRTQPMLHRAARDEQLAAMRYRVEVKAAAILHDTVLSHLAAIAGSTKTTLSPALRQQVEHDLGVLTDENWLLDETGVLDTRADVDWLESRLFATILELRELGLDIELSGELNAVSRLNAEAENALALAVNQCLVNVLRHSGTTQAEVAVFGSEADVSVMVIDAGRGFSEADTDADRLGLRQSVRQRIENIDGSVQVWSTPGRGTSIMIRVPVSSPDGGDL
jgi:signal transduction histidine kinase